MSMMMKENTTKKVIKWLWIVALAPFVSLFLVLLSVSIFADLPSFEELEDPKSNLATELISEEGEIINTFHIENRSFVSFDELSPNLVKALVATEDVRFYSHCGIDFRSLARVMVKTFVLGDSRSGGGSTITQQLAKTLFPRESTKSSFPGAAKIRLVVNKFKEWITAVKLERNYTKDEIMTMYLNAIFFGSNSYGVRAAANTFFNKEPYELNYEESATLVGMINKPTRYNPVLNYDRSLSRRNHVLIQMYNYDYLTKAEYDSLSALPIVLQYKVQDHNAGLAPHFRDLVRREMSASEPKRSNYEFVDDYIAAKQKWQDNPFYGWLNKNRKPDGSKYNLDKDGLKIYTTINAKMQQFAEEAVDEHIGSSLQRTFSAELRYKPNRPFALDVPKKDVERVMKQARRWSERYRSLKKEGASDKEIEKSFETKTKMRVFTWKGKGYADTIMTPNDSIRYYKSMLRASFVAVEPYTGEVKAYVGGHNYRYFKYDNASQGKRQVGSTIKPFLYTLAMQEGYTPCDMVMNVPQTFVVGDTTWTPKSTDKEEWIGTNVSLKWALTKSSNNISAYLMRQFGPEAMVEMCRKLGITTHLPMYPSLCLGPVEIPLIEMVSAYNTFPSRGVYSSPTIVTRIEDKDGNVLGNFTSNKKEAISEETAYLMANLMQGVVTEGTANRIRWKYQLTGEIAGKTGTTNDQSDGWFIGYTPKLTAGVWVGAEDRQVHFESIALGGGSNMALPIWGIFMKKVLEEGDLGVSANDKFVPPTGLVLDLNCDGSDTELEEDNFNNDDTSYFN